MAMNGISNLASLLRENGDKVLNGQSKLCLTVSLLRNLNEAFTVIVENDEGCSTFHVINTNDTQVETLNDILFLHDFVQKTVGLKISNSAVTDDSVKGTLDICKFRNLKYLELRRFPVLLLRGIQSVRMQLQSVVCIHCIQRLEDLLLDCGADHSTGFVWSDLREAVFSYNGIDFLDCSLQFAPWLQILDLSHNKISQAEAIDCLPNLKYLNLSYNLLESVPVVNKDACRKLQVLVIKNNYIEDLSGLVMLESLLELDLSCNCLSDHCALTPLLWLSTLIWLSLEGNPLSFHPQHRTRTAQRLHDSTANGKFMLDRMPLSKAERLCIGSLGGVALRNKSCKDDTSSAGSCSASENTLIPERGDQSVMKPHHGPGSKKSGRVREAVISDQDGGAEDSDLSSSFMTNSIDLSTEHLETKKQIETLRERFGEENWLHSHAGSCVQDVLGLHKAATVPSAAALSAESPQHHSATIVTSTHNEAGSDGCDATYTLETEKDSVVREGSFASKALSSDIRNEEGSREASPESVEVESEDEECEGDEEDEDEEQLYLVQRQRVGTQNADELFLVVTERQLKEREVLCGKTHERWTMASLLSCNRIRGEGPTATVHLTFDTVRRDRQERVYVMEEKDAQKLVRTLGEVLDARPLTAMNQLVFRCMKCSTQFSKELPVTGVGEKMLTCPTCNSTLVIEMDEIPLPSHYRNDRGEKQFVAVENGPLSSGLHSSPSQSSIGRPVSDTGASTVMYGGDRLQVTAMIHHNEAQQQPSRSAASLDPFADSPNNMRVAVKQWDSDIEIISNPSQSSIEVLYEHARLQGGVAPASSRSSEEKQMVSVAVTSQQPVVPEAASHVVTLTGLTESSSSSSLTDSICTTYEIHSESLSLRQESMTANLEERQSIITVSDRNTSTNTKVNEGMHETAEKLSDGSVKKSVHEDENPEMLFKMHEEKLSSRMNYASMLEGLLQSVGSKLPSKSSENVIESSDSRGAVIGNDGVKYSYSDFSIVDHRVKLHLYLHVFQQEQEELLFLLRAHIVPLSATLSYPGCLVMSSRKVYILQITGEEGDDPEKWLRKVESSPIETAILLFPLLCQQGIGMELLHEGGEQPSCFLFILPDPNYTVNFFSFLTGVRLPEQCKVDHAVVERQTLAVQQLLLSAAASDATDPTICACAVSYSCSIQRNKEKKDVGMGAITVTTTDLLLMMDNLQWLFPKSTVPPHTHSGQITNLIEVEMEDQCQLTLHFLDEAAGSDESWTLKFGSDSTLESIVSAIRIPWEQLFSVPLQIVNKNISVV